MKDDDGKDAHDVVQRWYADSFRVGHSALQFKVDCGHPDERDELMTVYLRMISTPSNARELFRLLGVSLLHYADRFGPIGDDRTQRSTRGGS